MKVTAVKTFCCLGAGVGRGVAAGISAQDAVDALIGQVAVP